MSSDASAEDLHWNLDTTRPRGRLLLNLAVLPALRLRDVRFGPRQDEFCRRHCEGRGGL